MFEKIQACDACGQEVMTDTQKYVLMVATAVVATAAKEGIKFAFKTYVNSKADSNVVES